MNMSNQKGFANIVLILVIVAIVAVGGYFVFSKISEPVVQQPTPTPTQATTPTKVPVSPAPTSAVNTTKITDKANLYSVEIPKDWKITRNEGAKGGQLSDITGESPDWKYRVDNSAEGPCTPSYYESGVSFQFHVNNQEDAAAHYGEGGGPDTGVISKKNISIGGVNGVYHVFKEPCTSEGQLVDAHVNYNGNGYLFRFAYNPSKYPQAETAFMNILNSIKFTK